LAINDELAELRLAADRNWQTKNPIGEDGAKERAMGFEAIASATVSAGNQRVSDAGAAKASVAVCPPLPADADLNLIVDTWPRLPEPLQADIVAMVKAATLLSVPR
jgi:hypothetical protein